MRLVEIVLFYPYAMEVVHKIKIEAGLKNTCFLSMTEDAKQDYLKARVNEIIKACIKQKIHNSTQK